MPSIELNEIKTSTLRFFIPADKSYMADIIAGNSNLIANVANIAALAAALGTEPKKIAHAILATSDSEVSTNVLRVTILRISAGENYKALADCENHEELSAARLQIMQKWNCHEFCFNDVDYEDLVLDPTPRLSEAAYLILAFESDELRSLYCTDAT